VGELPVLELLHEDGALGLDFEDALVFVGGEEGELLVELFELVPEFADELAEGCVLVEQLGVVLEGQIELGPQLFGHQVGGL
jgi:hypothetical protein